MIQAACRQAVLQPGSNFVTKCIQLYETVCVRHGLMLVGKTLSGKTRVMRTLRTAMSAIKGQPGFTTVRTHTINPKSVKQTQLYGCFDENTHEWTDGILAITIRNCSKVSHATSCHVMPRITDPRRHHPQLLQGHERRTQVGRVRWSRGRGVD